MAQRLASADSVAHASPSFAARLIAWQRQHGRNDLPWQNSRDPYRIWLSEVMLQQTQVATVIPYYLRFLAAFPDVAALAAVSLDEVLALWSGLGYYRRAQHLQAAARVLVRDHDGSFPRRAEAIARLPGVGRSTANAIAAFAFGERGAILDGNVKRVFTRHRAVEGRPGSAVVERLLWAIAEDALPDEGIERYTQGLMDLGATVCIRHRPRCPACPVAKDCRARLEERVHALPAPRARRVLARRAVRMLVLESDGEVLLERRPPTGVWAGLWSLPEIALEEDPASTCRARFAAEALAIQELAPIEHAFTHFALTIHPLRIQLAVAALRAEAPGQRWLARDQAGEAALPAPVKRLLQALTLGPKPD